MTPESGICPEKSKSMAVIAFLVTNMLTSEYANQFYFNFNFFCQWKVKGGMLIGHMK